jgi:hypothetical protein
MAQATLTASAIIDKLTSVYFSRDPADFGMNHDEGHFVCTLPLAAPEIIQDQGQY